MIDKVLNIGLVGAPGSGKSNLALHLADAWPLAEPPVVVDDYAQDLSEYTNLALGPYATYVGNTLVATERLKREVRFIKRQVSVITCGTIIETAAYMSMKGGLVRNGSPEATRIGTAMQYFGMLFQDTSVYDYLFYLPLAENDESIAGVIDTQILEALQIFGVPYTKLDGPDPIKDVLNVITVSSTD